MNNVLKVWVLVFCLSASGFVNGAEIEEVIVTAQMREQALNDVPLSINAYPEETLERKGVVAFTDVVKIIPGASFGQAFSPTNTTLTIRGVGGRATTDPSVAFYIDETPFAVPAYSFSPPTDMFDIERVEVLRGPQGTLYGLGSMGGAVRVLTADPSHEDGFSGKAQVSWADTKDGEPSYRGNIALNLPVVEDTLTARIVLGYREDGGFIDSPDFPDANGDEDINETEYEDIRAKVLYTPTEDLELLFTYWENDVENLFGNTTSTLNGREFFGSGGLPSEYLTDFELSAISLTYTLGFATLENNLSYLEYRNVQAIRADFGGVILDSTGDFPSEATTNELRLVSNSGGRFHWVTGLYYRKGELNNSVSLFFGIPFPDSTTDIESEAFAIYAEGTWSFLDDKFDITAGARYFEDERKFSIVSYGFPFDDATETFDSINPRFNVSYRPAEDKLLYFNMAKGFRSGIVNNPGAVSVAIAAGFPDPGVVESDELWSYEIGTKMTLLDGALSLQAALYRVDWQDQQFQVVLGGLGMIVNTGDSKLEGVEMALDWATPVDGLTIGLSANVNSSEFDDVNPAMTAVNPAYANGVQLPTIPESTASLTADYVAPIGKGGLDLLAGASYAYRDSQGDPSVGAVYLETDEYESIDLYVGIASERWEATLFAKNVTDEDTSISRNSTLFGAQYPRQIGLRVKTNF